MNDPKAVSCWSDFKACFASAPPSLNTLRQAFAAIMQFAWSDPSRFDGALEELKCLTWSKDPAASNLNIGSSTAKNPGDTEHVPGIYVSLPDGLHYELEALGGTMMAERMDYAGGTVGKIARGKIVLSCKHTDADVSCMMGDYCSMVCMAVQPRLWDIWGRWLLRFELEHQSEPAMKAVEGTSSQSAWYESQVVLSIDMVLQVDVLQESKRLKDFSMESNPAT